MAETTGKSKAVTITGWILIGLVAFALIAAGAAKLFGFAPQELVQSLEEAGLGDRIKLIGAGALVTGILLVVPVTSSFGVLMASSYWGGAICMHMTKGEPYTTPAVLLLMTWVGATMRDPAVMNSFRRRASSE